MAQDKLVRCVRGAIWDVAVDVRAGSPTFGGWVGVVLSADNFRQLLVPTEFAHGFCVLSDEAEVLHKTGAVYSAAHDGGIAWPLAEPLLPDRASRARRRWPICAAAGASDWPVIPPMARRRQVRHFLGEGTVSRRPLLNLSGALLTRR